MRSRWYVYGRVNVVQVFFECASVMSFSFLVEFRFIVGKLMYIVCNTNVVQRSKCTLGKY